VEALSSELEEVIVQIVPVDEHASASARARHDSLAKPQGSLGRLEEIAIQLAGIAAACPPPVPDRPAVAVFAGDHGVCVEGVTPWPSKVTALMLDTIADGGAAVNALAQRSGATVTAVAVGVIDRWTPSPRVLDRTVRRGTANLATDDAMTPAETIEAVSVGVRVAVDVNGRWVLNAGGQQTCAVVAR